MKRRKLHTDEDWAEVAAGCSTHHDHLDLVLKADEMLKEVRAAIARRPPIEPMEERQAPACVEVKEEAKPELPWLQTPF